MEELIKGITNEVEAVKKLPYSPFRDVAVGALHSAVHGLRTAVENLEHHARRMEGSPSPLPSPPGEGIRAK